MKAVIILIHTFKLLFFILHFPDIELCFEVNFNQVNKQFLIFS